MNTVYVRLIWLKNWRCASSFDIIWSYFHCTRPVCSLESFFPRTATAGATPGQEARTVTKTAILRECKKENVRFLRLQFTDIHGANKNVEVPASQFGKALDGKIMFDGSSIQGFTRIE